MRDTSQQLADMLDGSRQVTWLANVVRGDEAMNDLPVTLGGNLSYNASQAVELSGSIRATVASDTGESVAPTEASSLFAPFGSEVMLWAKVSVGDLVELVQVGRPRISEVPSVRQHRTQVGGQELVVAEELELELRDRMDVLLADDFHADELVRYPESAWAELDHLCPFPVLRNGSDAPLPATLTYSETRADAVQAVAQRLGGVAAFDSFGNLIVRKPATEPSMALVLGPSGTVREVSAVMSTKGVYNRVLVRGKRADGSLIQVERVATGALAPDVWGRRTYVADQGDFLREDDDAEAYAERLLARVSQVRTTELEVVALLDPRLELGDVVTVPWQGRQEAIEVTKVAYGTVMMTVTGKVLP